MTTAALLAKAAAIVLSDERGRKGVGWILVAIFSPVILLIVVICSLMMGGSAHNDAVIAACFYGAALPATAPLSFQTHVAEMQNAFALLDSGVEAANAQLQNGSLDPTQVKAVFYVLCADDPDAVPAEDFLGCFYDGEVFAQEDMYANLSALLGREITDEDLERIGYVYATASAGPVSAEGFCSPVGEGWRDAVTSEFGWRQDPFTGESSGHGGIDLAYPEGTPIRAALAGTVTLADYGNGSYGYHLTIDHGDGLVTLYAHCSSLLVTAGQQVQAGQPVALVGSTGRSTGSHLHFEVRVDGEKQDPRWYLP